MPRARADDTHYATPLLGDRSTGMGSAATGLADEASSAYYNPAGLATMQGRSASGGLWLRAFRSIRVHDAVRSGDLASDFAQTSSSGVPGFAAGSTPVGRRTIDGQRRFVLALSSFQLFGLGRGEDVVLESPTVRADALTLQSSDRQSYTGVSLGILASSRWSFGISVFVSRRHMRTNESFHGFVFGQDVTGPTYDDARTEARTIALTANAYHVVFRLGVLHRATARASWGLMLQLPGAAIRQRSSTRTLDSSNDATTTPAQATYEFEVRSHLPTYLPIPFELRAGTAYRISEDAVVALDLSFVGPVPDRPMLRTFDLASRSLFTASSRERRPVGNVAIGTEIAPWPKAMLRFGFFTDFSGVPRLPRESEVYLPMRVHRIGFSGSAGVRTRGRRDGVSFGVIAMFGRGTAMSASLDRIGSFERTSARERSIIATITGALATARRIARQTANRLAPGVVPLPPGEQAAPPGPEDGLGPDGREGERRDDSSGPRQGERPDDSSGSREGERPGGALGPTRDGAGPREDDARRP